MSVAPENIELYDPHEPKPPVPSAFHEELGSQPRTSGADKVHTVQMQIDETKASLQNTIREAYNKGQKLGALEETTAMLGDSASAFKTHAVHTRRNMWWKNAKMTIILTVTIVLILAAIIVPTVLKAQGKI